MNKKCGCKFRLCGCIKANHKKAFSLFQPKHFMSMVEVTTCKCLNKGTTTLSCPSPVFFSLTPPILHPLVSLVCISVQSFVQSLLCHLLCSLDSAVSLMFLHVCLFLYCHVKSGGAGSSFKHFTPGSLLPDLCHKILSSSFWTCIEVGIYSTDVTELHCSKITLFALVTAQPNSTWGG